MRLPQGWRAYSFPQLQLAFSPDDRTKFVLIGRAAKGWLVIYYDGEHRPRAALCSSRMAAENWIRDRLNDGPVSTTI